MARLLKSVLFFCAAIYVVAGRHEVYDGHSLYEVNVKSSEEGKLVNELENELPIDIFMYGSVGRPAHILVPKDVKPTFESVLSAQGIEYNIRVQNIRDQLLKEDQVLAEAAARANASAARSSSIGLNFDEIHSLRVVDDYLDRLGQQFPDIVSVASAGKTVEGRDMKYLKISTTNFQDRSKPVVYLMSLLHAREWVGLPASLYAIEKLVIDVQERDLLDSIDWIILPVANPDGYEFSHSSNGRFWRKNRARGFMVADFCMGVDLNRNFDIFWGTASSNNVCLDTFHGRGPFSEPETQNINRILQEHRDRIELYIDLHSFGSIILYAYGNGDLPPNVLTLNLAAVNQAQAIDRVKWPNKPNYVVGNIVHILYHASGGSSDYAQGIGIPLSYSYELPAWRAVSGIMDGFLVEPEFIKQAGMETWEGIKTGARFARDLYSRKSAK